MGLRMTWPKPFFNDILGNGVIVTIKFLGPLRLCVRLCALPLSQGEKPFSSMPHCVPKPTSLNVALPPETDTPCPKKQPPPATNPIRFTLASVVAKPFALPSL